MTEWLESVYSDGTADFVSNPSPKLYEEVKIRIRMYEDAPVEHVFLRYTPNGADRVIKAYIAKKEKGFNKEDKWSTHSWH